MIDKNYPHEAFARLNALWEQRELVWGLLPDSRAYSVAYLHRETAQKVTALKQAQATRCVICREERLPFFSDFLACAFAGVDVVLPPNAQPNTLDEVYQLSGANAMLGDDENALQVTDDGQIFGDIHDIAVTVYTSGSTGKPKAIRKPLSAYLAEVETLENLWGKHLWGATLLSSVSPQHVYGFLFGVLWPLTYAHRVWGEPVGFEERLHFLTRQLKHTVFVASPAILTRLTEQSGEKGLQMVFSSGGPLSDKAAEQVEKKLNTRCLRIFGSSETGGIAWQDTDNAYWQVLPGVSIGEQDGLLHLESPYSYQSPYLTADRITLLSNHTFMLHGRADDIVKVGEKRVALPAVEAALTAQKYIIAARVIALPEPRNALGAVLVIDKVGQAIQQTNPRKFYHHLKNQLGQQFDAVTLPKFFRVVDKLPENAQGKVLKSDLLTLFSDPLE